MENHRVQDELLGSLQALVLLCWGTYSVSYYSNSTVHFPSRLLE